MPASELTSVGTITCYMQQNDRADVKQIAGKSMRIAPSVPMDALDKAVAFRTATKDSDQAAKAQPLSAVEEWRRHLPVSSGFVSDDPAESAALQVARSTLNEEIPSAKPEVTVDAEFEQTIDSDEESSVGRRSGASASSSEPSESGESSAADDCWDVRSLVSSMRSFVWLDSSRSGKPTIGDDVGTAERQEDQGKILGFFLDVEGERGDEEAMLADIIAHTRIWHEAPKSRKPQRLLRDWMGQLERVRSILEKSVL